MLSQTAEYALRAVVALAAHPATPFTTRQLAEETQVPFNYLSKVLQSLARGGIVHSQRGLHGGFTLARPAGEITLLDVINTVDPIRPIETCPLNLKQHRSNLCPLHSRINTTILLIRDIFRSSTIQELLEEQTESKPLCESG